jgi:hypothetical protein
MSGRNGLTWVTALTIASLLLGSGVLNALAEGHGGGDHGGASGQGNAGHQQQTPAATHTSVQAQVSHDDAKHNNGNNADNKRNDANNNGNADKQRDDDNNDVDRAPDDDNDDLVTQPARVTDDVRPGLGCGDQNHEHERHDECKPRGDDADNDGAVDDDAEVVTVANAGDMAAAVVDDRDGD